MRKKHLNLLVLLFGFAVAIFLVIPIPSSLSLIAHADTPRMGIIGDSNSDEYRADDNRAGGTPYQETTLSWMELLATKKGFDFGPWGTWGGERRTGYKNNWARSGATTASMIANGQHTGLAQQVSAGEVDYALIYIGTNDFHSWNGTYDEIYNGTLSDTQLQAKVDSIVSNITLAVDTVKQAGQVKIVLTNFADPGSSADFRQAYPDASKRQRVTDAITQINQRLGQIATDRGVVLADMSSFVNSVMSRIDSTGNIVVGGEQISAVVHGNEPHHLQLGDSVGHTGTVGGGLLANFFASTFNTGYGLAFAPFTDTEILTNAGIILPTATPVVTATPTPTVVPTPTPIPTATATPRPTATPTAVPTATATPRPTATPTPTPVPTATPVPGTTVTFNDLSNPNRNFTGQYPTGIINWGTNQWYLSGPWGGFTTNSFSFATNVTSKPFTFVTAKKLASIQAYNGGTGSSSVSLACTGNTTKTVTVPAGQLMTIVTGWTKTCTTVTVGSSNGWWTNFDNLIYQ